jgi:ATP-dependent Lon protease
MPTFLRESEAFETADRLPVLPLRDVVVFPHVVMPLLVGRAASLAAVEAAMGEDRIVLLVSQRSGDVEEPAAADLHRVGVVARLQQVSRQRDGGVKVLVEGIARAKVLRFVPSTGLLKAQVSPLPFGSDITGAASEGSVDATHTRAAVRRALRLFEDYVALQRRIPPEVVGLVQEAATDVRQAFGVAAHLFVRPELRQQALEAPTLDAFAERLTEILTAELEVLRLEKKIEEDVRGSLFQHQREFYLQEQLKVIHRELGHDETDDLAELEQLVEKKALPEAANARAQRELRRLRRMAPMSPEAAVARGYLDWLLSLPWTERSDEHLDVAHAREVLDEDHFGLAEVKERIVDFIAVLALAGRLDGPILCLVGPPGVGKTSLGRSIARALGRHFVRISLGGVRDEAEIRGHRRTYVGALPGRIIQAMRRAEVVNPVILLDEIDKLGQDFRGDPSAALLEVLDPEQNNTFSDHFLEVEYDLSQALFLTTANSLAHIPEPLRDRMEIIRLAGYLEQEKLSIARDFLVPRQLRQHGIDPTDVEWEPGALAAMLRGWTREAGVRDLERRIARIARKLARRKLELLGGAPVVAETHADDADEVDAEDAALARVELSAVGGARVDSKKSVAAIPHTPSLFVRVDELTTLLGPAPYDPDDVSLEDKIGVATGLAYTSVGGETLELEVSVVPGRGKLQLTGTLGDVMKESASAALSYIRARAERLGLAPEFQRALDIHLHIPAGATPKDGPSAGIAMATALVSALTGAPVRGDTAMTGEITLRGRVLPIGGLKEKAVAAHRAGVTRVIIPHGNARDVGELPEEVREAIEWIPVRTIDEVLQLALRAPLVAYVPTPTKAARTPARAGAAVSTVGDVNTVSH